MRSSTTRPHLGLLALISLSCGGMVCGLAACQTAATSKDTANMTDLLLGEWTLTTIGSTDIARQISPGGKVPSLTFTADGKITGTGGINRLMGSFDPAASASGNLTLGRMASTLMAGEPGAMQLENQFLAALGKVDSFTFLPRSNGLFLKQGKETLLTFTRTK